MKPARLAILGVAALAGVGAFLLILSGTKPPEPVKIAVSAPPPPMDQVLVADQDIPFGNTIELGDLRWQAWPKNKAPAGVILQSKDLGRCDRIRRLARTQPPRPGRTRL